MSGSKDYELVDDGPMTEAEKLAAHFKRTHKASVAEDYSVRKFAQEGLPILATVPADECAIVGHKWLPGPLPMTRWCRTCKRWESL